MATVVLTNPGCRDYLLTVLDDPAVAGERLSKIRTLDQYVTLTQVSGLTLGTAERPNLAHVLQQQREHIMSHVRDLATVSDLDGAVLLARVLGSKHNTGWAFELVERYPAEGQTWFSTSELLWLARQLSQVPAEEVTRQVRLVHKLVLAGIARVRTIQDLDAYEAFPESLLPDSAQEQLRDRAQRIIRAELDHLMYYSDDPQVLTADAYALRQRAAGYGLDLDIAALLDRADDLAQIFVREPDLDYGDHDPAAIFRHLAD